MILESVEEIRVQGVEVYDYRTDEEKAQPWCTDCNLPMDICRGHDRLPSPTVETIVILWQQLDAMQEIELAAAIVRFDARRADGFFTTLGMALEAVQSPQYVGEDA